MLIQRTSKPSILLFIGIVSLLSTSCMFGGCEKSVDPEPVTKSLGASTSAHTDTGLVKKLLDFTSGTRVKLVWLQSRLIDDDTMNYVTNFKDFLFNAPASQLIVFDTDEPVGRILDAELSSRSTPLISRDGSKVLWSDFTKQALYAINWDGTGKKVLLQGEIYHILCVQWDKAAQTEWLYVANLQGFPFTETAQGNRIYRYPLEGMSLNTAKKELVSQRSFHSPWTVSGDGKYACGDIDWPNARVESLPQGQLFQISDTNLIVCHAQIAPDTSYYCFYFPQNHWQIDIKRFSEFFYRVSLNGDGTGMNDCTCPRWTNNIQYLTGGYPYCAGWFYSYVGTKRPSDPRLIPPGATGEFCLGKFDANFQTVQWVRVTDLDKRFRKCVGDGWLANGEGPGKP
jgi:hypothetical protein